MTAYIVIRVVGFPGGTISWPLKAYDSEKAAKDRCDADNRMLNELDGAQLMYKVAEGHVDTGMSLSTFLAGLGLVEARHKVVPMEVAGLLELPKIELVTG